MFYFDVFPQVEYEYDDYGNTVAATDITKRFKFIENVLKKTYIFYDYSIKDEERPDIIAHKYYKDAKVDWVILLINKIIDPLFEWPMSNVEFEQFLIKKYGSIATSKNTVHSYEQIVSVESVDNDGNIIPEYRLLIDQTVYNTLSASERKTITKYDYENELNESHRDIKLVDRSFLPQILAEVEKLY